MIIKWIILFTLLDPTGNIRTGVVKQSVNDLDHCKTVEAGIEAEILKNIQAGKLQNGFAECKLIKVKLPGSKEA